MARFGGPVSRLELPLVKRKSVALIANEVYSGGEYDDEEFGWIKACAAYFKRNRIRYPADTDFLKVAHLLGYRKVV